MLYRIIAAALMLTFYGFYFVKMFAQRKKGITTNQMGRGKAGKVKIIETLLSVATMLVPLTELVSVILGTSLLPDAARIVGAVIAAAGVTAFAVAIVQMRDSWRAGVPQEDKTELVTRGIYRISRNPAFLGFDLLYAGIALMLFSWWLLAVSFFAAVMIHLQVVVVEEPFLQAAFGEEYSAYRGKVCRYLGVKRFGK